MSESQERYPAGPRGGKGRAVVVLFLLAAASGVGNLFWTAHEVNSAGAAQHREQVAQQRAGEVAERKLCTTLSRLAALKPPPGSAADNPSRAYLQGQHATLAELGPDLGCR